jgi:hypothetical protein
MIPLLHYYHDDIDHYARLPLFVRGGDIDG